METRKAMNGKLVRFVIESHCPYDGPSDPECRRALASHLPIATWVYWPGQKNKSILCKTNAPVYLVSPQGISAVNAAVPKQFEVSPGAFYYVCEHMGRIIE